MKKYNNREFQKIGEKQKSMSLQRKKQIIFSYLVFIKYQISQLSIIWYCIKIINGLYLVLICLKKLFLQFFVSHRYLANIDRLYYYLEGRNKNFEESWVILSCFWLMLILCLVIYYKMEINLCSNKKRNNLLSFIIYYPILLIIVIELWYSYISYLIFEALFSFPDRTPQSAFLVIISLIFILGVGIFNYNNRVFSTFLFFVVGITTIQNNIIVIFLIVLSCLVMIYRDRDLISQCIYVCFSTSQVYKFIEIYDDSHEIQEMIFLFCGIVFSLVIIVSLSVVYNKMGSNMDNNLFLVSFISNYKNSDQKGVREFKKFLRLQGIFREFIHDYRLKIDAASTRKIIKQPFKYFSRQQLIQAVDKKLTIDYQREPQNYQIKNIYFTFRIKNFYKIIQTMNLIGKFLEKNQGQNYKKNQKFSYKELYVKKNIQQMISRELMSKQQDNDKVYQLIQLSKTQSKFLQKSMQILCAIHLFWQKIGMSIIIESQIYDNLSQIQKSIKILKELLFILKKGYQATREINLMGMITNLMQPCSIAKNISVCSQCQLEYKEETLIFFQQRNQKIVHASPCFLKFIKCTSEEILNQSISQIIPEEIIKSLSDNQCSDIKSSKSSYIVPIICYDLTIKICEIDIKLVTESNLGIFYFYFIKKIENQNKFAYIYINTIDLQIRYVSEQFYLIFGINKEEFRENFNFHHIFLNNIVFNYDMSKIINDLIDKRSIKCNFSVESLLNRKINKHYNHNKYIGFLNLLSNYESHLLLYINITEDQFGLLQQELKIPSSNKYLVETKTMIDNNKAMYSVQKISLSIATTEQNQTKKSEVQSDLKKIFDKQQQINSETKTNIVTYSNCIKFMVGIIIAIVVVMPIILIAFSGQKQNMVENIILNIRKAVDQTNLLVEATFEVFLQYTISKNYQFIQEFLMNNTNQTIKHITVSQLLDIQYSRIHDILHQFNSQFISFFYRSALPNPYTFIYENFNISTDFSKTNLISYLFNLKLASQRIKVQYQTLLSDNLQSVPEERNDNLLLFLLMNYPAISNLYSPFDSVSIFTNQLENQTQFIKIIICSLSSACILIILVIVPLIQKNLEIIYDVLQIFILIDRQTIESRIRKINSVLEMYFYEVPIDNIKRIVKLNEIENKMSSFYQSYVENGIKSINGKQEQSNQDEDDEEKKIVRTRNNVVIVSFIYVVEVLFVMLMLFLVLGLLFSEIHANAHVNNIIFEYYNQIQFIKHKQLKKSCDMIHHKLAQQILNITTPISIQVFDKQSSVNRQLSKNYPQQFAQYFANQHILLTESLCKEKEQQLNKESQIFMGFINCSSIGLGILNQGLGQALEYFDETIIALYNQNISLLDMDENSVYPNIVTHLEIRQRIVDQFSSIEQLLINQKTEINKRYENRTLIYSVVCYGIVLSIIVLMLCKFIPETEKIKEVGIGYFKCFTKETLMKKKISAFIGEKRVLERISLL